MAKDNELNIKVSLDDKTKQGTDSVTSNLKETQVAADKASFSFLNLSKSLAGVLVSLVSISLNLARLAKEYLGLTVNIETTNTKLKVFDFFVQNTRKEITLSLGFLKRFADYLEKINFPIERLTKFIDLMGDFRVVIGIGKGEQTIFEHAAEGLKKAAVAAKDFNLDDFKGQLKSAAASLLLFSTQAVTTFASLKKGIGREESFSAASRTISGTKDELAALKVQIDDISATKLAVPVEDLYAVAGIAGAMGKSLEEIPQFLQLVSEAAIAFNIPAESVAEKLATIQTQLALTDDGVVSLADQVNALADSMPGKVNELDVFEVLSTGVATAGKSFGLLKGETIALTGALLSLGEAPETARTAIVSLLTKLQTAKVGSKDFQQALTDMGTSADKLKEDIRTKPMPTLVAFLKQLKGFDEFKKKELLTGIMGTGGDMNAVAKLTDAVDLLEKSLGTATDATQYSGSVHNAYQQQIATSAAKITLLKNALDNFFERLTSTFLPAINLVVDGITKMVNAISTFSQNHPIFKTIAAVSVSILSLAGVFRLFSFAFSKLIPIISSNLAKVGLSMASFTLSLAGVGAVIAAISPGLVLLARNIILAAKAGEYLKILRLAFGFLFGGTIGVAIGALSLLFLAISNLLPVTVKWGEVTTTIGKVISAAFSVIIDNATAAYNVLSDFFISIGKFALQLTLGITAVTAAIGTLILAIQTGLAAAIISTIPAWISAGTTAFLALSPVSLLLIGIIGTFAALEVASKSLTGEWLDLGGVLAGIGEIINSFIRGIQEMVVFTIHMVNTVIAWHEFLSESLAAIFDDSTIEEAQKRRNDKILAEDERFIDEMNRIRQNNPIENFKSDIEKSLNQKKLDEADKKSKDKGSSPPDADAEAAKKLADLKAQIEKEARAKKLQDLRDTEAENIRIIQNSAQTQKQIDDAIFAEKIRSAKEITQAIKNQLTQEQIDLRAHQAAKQKYTQEELTAKKASLKDIQTAYKAQIDALNTLEEQHRDKVITLDAEIRDVKKQGQTGAREIARAGMTDAQVSADKQLEIDEKTAQIRQLMQQQEYAKAVELGKELNALSLEQAKAAAAAKKEIGALPDNSINQQKYQLATEKLTVAQFDYKQSIDITNQALEAQKAEEQKKADEVKAQADAQRVAYENVGKQIEELNKTLVTGGELKIIVDTSEVDVLKQKLDDLPKEKIINIKWTSDKDFTQYVLPQTRKEGGFIHAIKRAFGGHVPGVGSGDIVPAMLEPGEFVLNRKKSTKEGARALNALNSDRATIISNDVLAYLLNKVTIKRAAGGFAHADYLSQKASTIRLPNMPNLSNGTTINNFNSSGSSEKIAAIFDFGKLGSFNGNVNKSEMPVLESINAALKKEKRVTR